eukprot:m.30493 g.30493  ORF g.30493 m.30493 type:complete len:145 (+) comp31348_c0_seq2:218-652(+)
MYVLKKRSLQRKKLMAEGAGTTLNQTGLRQLQDIERRFLIIMILLFAVTLCLAIEYSVFGFLKQGLDLKPMVQDYFSCVLLHPDKICPRAPKIEQLLFVRDILYRVIIILVFVSQFLFFSASKDVKKMWRNILTRCFKRERQQS